MKFVPPPSLAKRLGRVAGLIAAATLAVPAVASAAACPQQPTTTPFTQWGDPGSYFLAPSGNFEAPLSSSGWGVVNAERTPGNEPFDVGSSSDANSLTINGGGVAVSPQFCVDNTMPFFRFFAHALSSSGDLNVRLVVQTPRGLVSIPFTRAADLPSATMPNWAPTAQLTTGNTAVLANGQAEPGRLVFTAVGSGGWQIDDIYVDPFRTG